MSTLPAAAASGMEDLRARMLAERERRRRSGPVGVDDLTLRAGMDAERRRRGGVVRPSARQADPLAALGPQDPYVWVPPEGLEPLDISGAESVLPQPDDEAIAARLDALLNPEHYPDSPTAARLGHLLRGDVAAAFPSLAAAPELAGLTAVQSGAGLLGVLGGTFAAAGRGMQEEPGGGAPWLAGPTRWAGAQLEGFGQWLGGMAMPVAAGAEAELEALRAQLPDAEAYTPEWFMQQLATSAPATLAGIGLGVATGGVGFAAVLPTFVQEGGLAAWQTYQRQLGQHGDPDRAAAEALTVGMLTGGASAALEHVPLSEYIGRAPLFRRMAEQIVGEGRLARLAGAAMGEALTEPLQGASGELIESAVTGSEIEPGFVSRRLQEAAAGAVTGGAIAGGLQGLEAAAGWAGQSGRMRADALPVEPAPQAPAAAEEAAPESEAAAEESATVEEVAPEPAAAAQTAQEASEEAGEGERPEAGATAQKAAAAIQAVAEGRAAAMLYPADAPPSPEKLPGSVGVVRTSEGPVVFDPDRVEPAELRRAAQEGKLGELVGMSGETDAGDGEQRAGFEEPRFVATDIQGSPRVFPTEAAAEKYRRSLGSPASAFTVLMPDGTYRVAGAGGGAGAGVVVAPYAAVVAEARRLGVFEGGPTSKPALLERIRAARASAAPETALDLETATVAAAPPAAEPSPQSRALTIEERLEAKEREILARMKKRRIPRGRSSGATTLPQDIIDVAMVTAIRAAKLGVRTGKALSKVVADTAAELGFSGDVRRARRVARAILRDATKPDGSIDADELERAIGEVEAVGRRRSSPKTAANRAAGVTKPDRRVSERVALREKMRFGARAAAAAYGQGAREARAETRARLAGFIERIREQGRVRAMRAAVSERLKGGVRVEREQVKADTAEGIRAEAVRLLQENVPERIRGRYLAAVRDAKSLPRLAALLRRVQRDMATAEARGVLRAARKYGKRELGKLEPELRREADAAMGVIARARRAMARAKEGEVKPRMSLAELEALRDELQAALNTIKSVIHEQRNLDKVRIKGEVIEAAALREELLDRLRAREELPAPRRGAPEPAWVRRFLRRRTNWESLMRALDNWQSGGPGARLWGQILRSRRRALQLAQQYQDGLSEIVRRHGYPTLGHFQAELSGTLGPALQKTVNVVVGGRRLTMGEAAYLYAASTDVGFKARIRSGQPMQFRDDPLGEPFRVMPRDLLRVRMALPANVRAIVDEAKALYDATYFDLLSAVNKRLKGYHLEKVPGYWGIKLNRRYSEGRGTPQSWRRAVIRAMEEAGYMQERVGPSKTPMLLGDFGTDILLRSKAAATVVGKAETVKLLTRVLLHPEMMTAIRSRLGAEAVERLERRISLYSGGELFRESADGLVRAAAALWARGKTQLWVMTWARNAAGGAVRVANELPVGSTAYQTLLKRPPTLREFNELKSLSPELRERWEGHFLGSFYDPSQDRGAEARFRLAMRATFLQLLEATKAARSLRVAEIGEALVGAGRAYRAILDSLTISNYFDGYGAVLAYRHFLKVAPPNIPEEARQRWAARHATRVFERISNTGVLEYANDVQLDARESTLTLLFTTFTGDTAKAQNMAYEAWHRGGRRRARTALVLAVGAAVMGALSSLYSAALGEDEEKRIRAGVARSSQELLSLIPKAGPVLAKAAGGLLGQGAQHAAPEVEVPVLEVVNKVLEGLYNAGEAIERLDAPRRRRVLTAEDKLWRALGNLGEAAGEASGLPIVQYLRAVRKAVRNWGGGSSSRRRKN